MSQRSNLKWTPKYPPQPSNKPVTRNNQPNRNYHNRQTAVPHRNAPKQEAYPPSQHRNPPQSHRSGTTIRPPQPQTHAPPQRQQQPHILAPIDDHSYSTHRRHPQQHHQPPRPMTSTSVSTSDGASPHKAILSHRTPVHSGFSTRSTSMASLPTTPSMRMSSSTTASNTPVNAANRPTKPPLIKTVGRQLPVKPPLRHGALSNAHTIGNTFPIAPSIPPMSNTIGNGIVSASHHFVSPPSMNIPVLGKAPRRQLQPLPPVAPPTTNTISSFRPPVQSAAKYSVDRTPHHYIPPHRVDHPYPQRSRPFRPDSRPDSRAYAPTHDSPYSAGARGPYDTNYSRGNSERGTYSGGRPPHNVQSRRAAHSSALDNRSARTPPRQAHRQPPTTSNTANAGARIAAAAAAPHHSHGGSGDRSRDVTRSGSTSSGVQWRAKSKAAANEREEKEYKAATGNLFDTHTHLDMILQRKFPPNFKDTRGGSMRNPLDVLPQLINTEFGDDFGGCITVSVDAASMDSIDYILEKFGYPTNHIFGTFGIHPNKATQWNETVEKKLRSYLDKYSIPRHNNDRALCVAVGECGLDYYIKPRMQQLLSPKDTQKRAFRRQCKIATDFDLPLVIHSRSAEKDTLQILTDIFGDDGKSQQYLHIHCFTDSLKYAQRLLDLFPNCYIGFTGCITYRGSRGESHRNNVKNIPLDRILLETDGPYLMPVTASNDWKGICHSGHLWYTAECIAQIKNVAVETVIKQCRVNATKMYGV